MLLKRDEHCPLCPKHNWKHDKNERERGYGWQWRKLRNTILMRDNYLCQVCAKQDRITVAKEVDHIIPKSQGGTDDPSNLAAICIPCHREKTNKESHQ